MSVDIHGYSKLSPTALANSKELVLFCHFLSYGFSVSMVEFIVRGMLAARNERVRQSRRNNVL